MKNYFNYLKSMYSGLPLKKTFIFLSVLLLTLLNIVLFAGGLGMGNGWVIIFSILLAVFVTAPWFNYGVDWMVTIDMGRRK